MFLKLSEIPARGGPRALLVNSEHVVEVAYNIDGYTYVALTNGNSHRIQETVLDVDRLLHPEVT